MTKSTITRERLEQLADNNTICKVSWDERIELAQIALAAMDSEPVAEVVSIYGDPEAFGEREIRPLVGIQQMPYGTKLYRHVQPAPVVNEGLYKLANHIASSKNGLPDEWQDWADELETDIRRAAMLQTGTQTNEGTRQVDELAMWIKRLVRSLKNTNPDSKLPRDAMDYLTAKGLISVGDILR